jgi:starch phosphorylase
MAGGTKCGTIPRIPGKWGWAIGQGESYSDLNYQDQVEAESLYDLLERDVVPAFYDRGADRIPRRWVERMKATVDSLCHFVNTHRMVRDYVEGYYVKAHSQFRALDDNAYRARELSATIDRIRRELPEVWVASVEEGPANTVSVTAAMPVRAKVHLGRLSPQDVRVELYFGRVDMHGDLVEGEAVTMTGILTASTTTRLRPRSPLAGCTGSRYACVQIILTCRPVSYPD